MIKFTNSLIAVLILLVVFQIKVFAQTLVWSDEFNGTSVNTANWNFENGGSGWGNNEQQYYRPENTSVSGGFLTITARREAFGGRNYTSTRLNTAGKRSFKYGRMEARLQIPMGQGLWPAFWMLGSNIGSVGWPACGEIDIMEHINTENLIHGTIHWQGPNGYANYGGSVATTPASFHVYAVDWNASEIRWFIDGSQYHVVNILNGINSTQEFHNNFHFLLNLAVGGNWPGQTIDNSRFPAAFVVDYVRVYQSGTTPPPPPTGGAPVGQTIWLRGSNNRYVSSENGSAPMIANRASVQGWEKFVVVDAGSGKIALRGSNGRYVTSANGTGAMYCDRTTIQDWERFDWVQQGNGMVALRGSNARYVSSENGTAALTCNRTTIGGWEVFSYATTTAARLGDVQVSSTTVDVYPNVVANGEIITVNLKEYLTGSPVILNVTDLNGHVISKKVVTEKSTTLQISDLQKGIYHLQISNGGVKEIKRIVVK